MDKEALGMLALAFNFAGYALYFRSIFRRETKPHMFSWIVWGLIDVIAFAGEFVSGAGAGSWGLGASTALCLCVAALSFKYGERRITRSDWIAFGAALSAIPVWYATRDPLGAMILVTIIDAAGAFPTMRKSYADPYGESLVSWIFYFGWAFTMILALERYSFVTLIFPAELLLAAVLMLVILVARRGCLSFCRSKLKKTDSGAIPS